MKRTFVIAEAAACHDGELKKALSLCDFAKRADCDAVKFQYTSSPEKLAARRRASAYLEAYRLLAFPREWFAILRDWCDALDIEFMCTVYIPEDVAVVTPYISRFKVASFEATDAAFLEAHRGGDPDAPHQVYRKPMIVSTGMMRHEEVWPRLRGVLRPGDAILHCVSAYPAPESEMNLRAIRALWMFGDGIGVGFSDHSRHAWTGALAVAAGADVIEFHVRLSDTAESNADYAVARVGGEALIYVENIRFAETTLGDGVKRAMPSETAMLGYRVGMAR